MCFVHRVHIEIVRSIKMTGRFPIFDYLLCDGAGRCLVCKRKLARLLKAKSNKKDGRKKSEMKFKKVQNIFDRRLH